MKIPDVRRVSLFLLSAGVCSFMCWAIVDIIRLEKEISVSNEDVSRLIVKHRLWEKGEKVIFWPKGPRLDHDGDQGPGMLSEFMQTFFGDASPFSFVLCWPGLVAWSWVPIFKHVGAGMTWNKEDDHHWARSSSRILSKPVLFDAQRDQQRKPRVGNLLGSQSARYGAVGESFQRETRQVAEKYSEIPKGNDESGYSERDSILKITREENIPNSKLTPTEAEILDDTEFKRTVVDVISRTPGAGRDSISGPILYRSHEALLITGKREEVKKVMVSAWKVYKQYAWGFDELDLINLKGSNNHGGLGVTIIDSLDTLYIMGLHDQFNEAAEWVENSLDFSTVRSVSTVSEISVRVLGGLLSAYDLSRRRLFLDKAQELADRLLPAWDTATGIPMRYIDLASGRASMQARNRSSRTSSSISTSGRASGRTRNSNLNSATDSTTLASGRAPGEAWKPATESISLSDIASGQIEFLALARRTGVRRYAYEPVEKPFEILQGIFPSDGLVPTCFSPDSQKPTCSKVTFGEDGSRFYDSLLKISMLSADSSLAKKLMRGNWEQSMRGLLSLVRRSNPSSFVYIAECAERSGTDCLTILPKMEEVACFAPGMLALGADDACPELATRYMQIAEKLAETCYFYFPPQASYGRGVTDEYNLFKNGQDMTAGSKFPNAFGTKTIESYFHLWRKTGERKYRSWAWDIFQSLQDLMSRNTYLDSSFMANTLKYMYLLYSRPSFMPRHEWVFSTGAHPIKVQDRCTEVETIPRVAPDPEHGAKFTWKIENFMKRTHKEYYLSDKFGDRSYNWRLKLYPEGTNVPFLSVYLGIADCPAASANWGSRFADFNIVIVDQSDPNRSVKKHASHRFIKGGNFGGFGRILSLEDLHNPSFGYLVNDILIVEVEFLEGCGIGCECKEAYYE